MPGTSEAGEGERQPLPLAPLKILLPLWEKEGGAQRRKDEGE
jgi:hypothetical protein